MTQQAKPWRIVSLLLGGAVLLFGGWHWLFQPWNWISTADSIEQKQKSSHLPPPTFLKRLRLYHKAAQQSPLLRKVALSRVARTLSQQVHPARMERTYRRLLYTGTLSQWQQNTRDWNQLLDQINLLFPKFHLRAYKAYLMLRAGHLQKLRQRCNKLPQAVPELRQQALEQIWCGHGAFFGGWTKQAVAHYKQALQAIEQHPKWDRRTTHNWRLPAELSTVLYHLGLLALKEEKGKLAQQYFQTMAARWKIVRKRYTHHAPWYFAQLWSIHAALSYKNLLAARNFAKAASKFPLDQSQLLFAKYFINPQNLALLKTIVGSGNRKHQYSYNDSKSVARIYLILSMYRSNPAKAHQALSSLLKQLKALPPVPTLGTFANKHTRSWQFLPIAPELWEQLIRAIQDAPRPKPQMMNEAQLIRWLRLYQALSYLKLYDWGSAQHILTHLRKHHPTFSPPYLYLGILATEQGNFSKAHSFLSSYCKTHPNSVGVLYLTYASIQLKHPLAAKLLAQIKRYKPWRKTALHLHLLHKKKLPKKIQLLSVVHWWKAFGNSGLLARSDPHLHKRSLFWLLQPSLQQHPSRWFVFRSLKTSQYTSHFSLNTWLARYRYLALHARQQKKPKLQQEYLRRLRYIQSYYRKLPRYWYFLDRTLYTHTHGLLAIGM